ncbi:MAG: NADH-quinone oxidoreductase subunit I [Chloroflexi bacterium]|nr:NADH-quinone oxidoreductase subunit I [Chloroflexota bacterium]MCH7655304.1 NADH-quinone oxidoreductase subunit I [Chloroflexota bacterium]
MIAGLTGLWTTLRWLFKRPVTAHYPEQHLPVQERYMGFPALLWDETADEPFCTGCMVCVRECPTQCMSAQMHDNPRFTDGASHRRKIIETFEINLNRCILCGICVDVCAFDAIEMSHEHELASYGRAGARADLDLLLAGGRHYQEETSWVPLNAEKNVAGVALAKKAAAAAAKSAAGPPASPAPEGSDGAEVDA